MKDDIKESGEELIDIDEKGNSIEKDKKMKKKNPSLKFLIKLL